ncbi:hypothetical protein [Rothia nasimurium]|uniref:hypothetical protein n=1 Tax=Rothia nasimurium TaxID=85336 RepID=UPI003B9F7BA0
MATIKKVFAILFSISLLFSLSMWAWMFVDGIILQSSDPNIGAGILMVFSGFLALVFGVAWAVAFLFSRSARKRHQHP